MGWLDDLRQTGYPFLAGTLSVWIGTALALRAVFLLIRLVANPPGLVRAATMRAATLAASASVVLILISRLFPLDIPSEQQGMRFPLVWVMMPFFGWLVVGSVFMIGFRASQGWGAVRKEEAQGRYAAAGIWAIVGIVSGWLFKKFHGQVEVFRGSIGVNLSLIAGLLALSVVAVFAMSYAERATRARGATKAFATHIALLAGSILFGLPFAWLVVTSFKLDKDIANADALDWTPYILVTKPYTGEYDPLYEGEFKGVTVQGTPIEKRPDGSMTIDILKPMSMRGTTFDVSPSQIKRIPRDVPVVKGTYGGQRITGVVIQEQLDGSRRVRIDEPKSLSGTEYIALARDVTEVKKVGARWQNYPDALDYLPPDSQRGLLFLKNTLVLVVLSVIGTVLSCTVVAYAFARMRFPGRNVLFTVMLSTMMLPGAVTLLPQFLIFRSLGWIDTLQPLWVPAFFAGAFNVFLLRQFFKSIPMELEDAAKIDGCSYWKTLTAVMVPQIKPALAAISIWTAMGAWNNFMGPLIYISSPERMPISYALQLYQSERGGEPALMMAFTTLSILPILLLFFFAQRYFIEGVTLSGLGGR